MDLLESERHLDYVVGVMGSELVNNSMFAEYIRDRIKDYSYNSELGECTDNYYLEITNISKMLGYYSDVDILDAPVFTRGYRLLSKIKRIPDYVIEKETDYYVE